MSSEDGIPGRQLAALHSSFPRNWPSRSSPASSGASSESRDTLARRRICITSTEQIAEQMMTRAAQERHSDSLLRGSLNSPGGLEASNTKFTRPFKRRIFTKNHVSPVKDPVATTATDGTRFACAKGSGPRGPEQRECACRRTESGREAQAGLTACRAQHSPEGGQCYSGSKTGCGSGEAGGRPGKGVHVVGRRQASHGRGSKNRGAEIRACCCSCTTAYTRTSGTVLFV